MPQHTMAWPTRPALLLILPFSLAAGIGSRSSPPVDPDDAPSSGSDPNLDLGGTGTTVLHVLADDLGYADVGFHSPDEAISPALDELAANGIVLSEFYTYKFCAPARASTLSGRYPYHLGLYNNNDGEISLDYQLLPALLKRGSSNWDTHALGKWHLGWAYKNFTATYRGFDTFFGSSGNTADYWQHTIGGPSYECNGTRTHSDFIDAVGRNISTAPAAVFGRYDATVLTERALELVAAQDTRRSMYMYLAYHNVHEPSNAQLETVERFPHVLYDRRKTADAMLTEIDYGVGNITNLLKQRGMFNSSVVIFYTDNGGPGSHACNFPHRGYKFGVWEGSVRGVAFISSPMFPAAVRGTAFNGMAHAADWYLTVTLGIAGLDPRALDTNNTGPLPPDSFNLWDALRTGAVSPRTEVVHMPLSNQYVNVSADGDGGDCKEGNGCATSFRVGRYKMIMGWPGNDGLCHPQPLSDKPVPFGQSGGTIENGTHCVGGKWTNNQTSQLSKCDPFCIFDVGPGGDLSESVDLAPDPKYAQVVQVLKDRITALSASGAPMPSLKKSDLYKNEIHPRICWVAAHTGFWMPSDWTSPAVPPFPPSPPGPAPNPPGPSCTAAMQAACPKAKFPSFPACRSCCHANVAKLKPLGCKPKDFSAYCNSTVAAASPLA